jgi:hypothetical protein
LTAIFSIPELLHRTYITFNRTFSQRDFNVSEAEIARDDCNISNPLFEDNNFIRAHANGVNSFLLIGIYMLLIKFFLFGNNLLFYVYISYAFMIIYFLSNGVVYLYLTDELFFTTLNFY